MQNAFQCFVEKETVTRTRHEPLLMPHDAESFLKNSQILNKSQMVSPEDAACPLLRGGVQRPIMTPDESR